MVVEAVELLAALVSEVTVWNSHEGIVFEEVHVAENLAGLSVRNVVRGCFDSDPLRLWVSTHDVDSLQTNIADFDYWLLSFVTIKVDNDIRNLIKILRKINSKFRHLLYRKVITICIVFLHLLGQLRFRFKVALCDNNPHAFVVTLKVTISPFIEIDVEQIIVLPWFRDVV